MKNLRIGARLGIGFAVLLTLMAIMTAIGIWRLHTVNEVVLDVTGNNLAKERYISDWYRSIHSGVRRTTAIAKSTDPSLATFFAKEADTSTKYAAE
jgi:methyl-accepting chemotaxis protein